MINPLHLLVVGFLSWAVVQNVSAQVLLASTEDRGVNSNSTLRNVGEPDELVRAGNLSTEGRAIIFPFQLPTLAPGEVFATAKLSLTLMEKGNVRIAGSPGSGGVAPSYGIDLYGLGSSRSNAEVLVGDFYQGATPQVGATMLQSAFITNATPLGLVEFSGSALVDYLNAQYDNGANAGQWIFLRLNPNVGTGIANDQRYRFSMADYSNPPNAWTAVIPQIEYTAIPEQSAFALLAISLAVVLTFRRRREVP